jgi:hypothetical protein
VPPNAKKLRAVTPRVRLVGSPLAHSLGTRRPFSRPCSAIGLPSSSNSIRDTPFHTPMIEENDAAQKPTRKAVPITGP